MTNTDFITMVKSIEFWLTFLCTVCVVLITSGLIPAGTASMKIALAVVSLLQAYGFVSKSSMRTENETMKSTIAAVSMRK